MNASIKLAYHSTLKQIVHVDNADNGKSCNCKCLQCDEELEARQGQVRDWHFKHHINTNCTGGQETALHKVGKQILIDNSYIRIPGHNTINYSNAVVEKNLENIRPDVTALFDDEQIFFEVVVCNPVDSNKEKMFIEGRHKSVEIDLSGCLDSSFEEIRKSVLDETINKRVIYWANAASVGGVQLPLVNKQNVVQKTSDWLQRVLFTGFVILVFLGVASLFTQRRRK